jgi:hypothetical protein
MSYWATSPLIRPGNYQYHHRNEGHGAREGCCFMDDPNLEQPEFAALRRMSEDLRARRELFRQFRRELLKVKLKQRLKQAAAAAAYLVPLCLLWWRLGIIRAFFANWRHDVDLVNDLGELVGALLILTFNGLIVWMICRKVKNPGWEVGWRIIFFCILFYLVILLAGPPNV